MSKPIIIAAVISFIVLNMVKVALTWDDSYKLIVSKEKTTFLDAYIRCHQRDFDGIEILSREDEERVENALSNELDIIEGWQNGFWIFAVNSGKTCNYYWLDSGKPLIFNQYAPGQPDNTVVQNCLEISKKGNNFEWHDVPCDMKLRFICKMKVDTNRRVFLYHPPTTDE